MLRELGLVLATETTITATEMAIAGDIQKELRLRRIHVQVESGPADIGMDIGLGVRRENTKHRKRAQGGLALAPKIRRTIGKHNASTTIMGGHVSTRACDMGRRPRAAPRRSGISCGARRG